jgi:hypothetical protein
MTALVRLTARLRREQAVALLARGLPLPDVAAQLGASLRTLHLPGPARSSTTCGAREPSAPCPSFPADDQAFNQLAQPRTESTPPAATAASESAAVRKHTDVQSTAHDPST